LRVAFAGTPAFAARALEAIAAAGHEIPLVLTQPDRPAGRGLALAASPVAQVARARSFALDKPATLKTAEALERLRAARPDVLVVAAYGLILPRAALQIPPRGCINIHASLLPRWRGAAPIHRAILAGDTATGVSIMLMDEGLDTGPVLLEREIEIGARATTGMLTERLSSLGAEAIVDALSRIDSLVPRPQDAGRATYAPKVAKSEAILDWNSSAEDLDRVVRAFDPTPGAQASLGGESVKIREAEPVSDLGGPPGTVLRASGDELIVACGSGALRIRRLQRPGGRNMVASEFLRGNPLTK
jgi:methionyl-tRNA formyltransferase